MTENEIRIKLLRAQAKALKNLEKVAKGMIHLEKGNLQAAADSVPEGDDPPNPPGGDDEDGD